jgi:hypothetical protein
MRAEQFTCTGVFDGDARLAQDAKRGVVEGVDGGGGKEGEHVVSYGWIRVDRYTCKHGTCVRAYGFIVYSCGSFFFFNGKTEEPSFFSLIVIHNLDRL